MRRKHLLILQIVVLFVLGTSLYFRGSKTIFGTWSRQGFETITGKSSGKTFTDEAMKAYINSILDPNNTDLPRLSCPPLHESPRYSHLATSLQEDRASTIQFLFALNLRNSSAILPRLLGSVVEAIQILGPSNCALSIVEGNSDDGTFDILEGLRPSLDKLKTTYYLRSSKIDPKEGDRIAKLADLRNMALQPLLEEPHRYTADTTVIFLNDVAACSEDILELIYQRQVLGADMSCGFDWVYVGRDPTFYDVWVARGMAGDSFFEIPADGNWNSAWNLFWNDDRSRASFAAHKPFQVFSCWNGAAVFTAKPIVEKAISFRGPRDGECKQGEPQLFCKDMWFHGYGKIAVIPSVNLEYSDANAQKIKDLKGYTSQWATSDATTDDKVEWESKPPDNVKCIPTYETQSFRPWNETLG